MSKKKLNLKSDDDIRYLINKNKNLIEKLIKTSRIMGVTDEIEKEPSNGVPNLNKTNGELEEYQTDSYTEDISIVELAVINSFLHDTYRKKVNSDITINSYGKTDSVGRIEFNGAFDNTQSFWFRGNILGVDNDFIFQTKIYVDGRGELIMQLHIACKKEMGESKLFDIFKDVKKISFNKSDFVGKCIKVKLRDYRFKGIEIIDIEESSNELILNEVQRKFIEHFISRFT